MQIRWQELFDKCLEKAEHYLAQQDRRFVKFWESRQSSVVIRTIFGLIAAIITLYVVRHEFPELFDDLDFLLLVFVWGLYGFILFMDEYRQAKKKAIDKKRYGVYTHR